MNGMPQLFAPGVLTRDQLLHLRENIVKYGTLQPENQKCTGKASETYVCHRDQLHHFPYVTEARDIAFFEINDKMGCDIGHTDWHDSFLYNIYKAPSNGYPWHIDTASVEQPFTDCKITMIINTSVESYQGGGLHIAFNNFTDTHFEPMDESGNTVLFRSHTLHRVDPVTSGERTSLTLFFKGPKWR